MSTPKGLNSKAHTHRFRKCVLRLIEYQVITLCIRTNKLSLIDLTTLSNFASSRRNLTLTSINFFPIPLKIIETFQDFSNIGRNVNITDCSKNKNSLTKYSEFVLSKNLSSVPSLVQLKKLLPTKLVV